nr:MAG TPA: Protein of unknown function (DUF2768) [Caudoviricetes sp.]DAY32670.1 MAG TPA: Protein of unknown function (DUF2768) [Caudoviricetes sp.]
MLANSFFWFSLNAIFLLLINNLTIFLNLKKLKR